MKTKETTNETETKSLADIVSVLNQERDYISTLRSAIVTNQKTKDRLASIRRYILEIVALNHSYELNQVKNFLLATCNKFGEDPVSFQERMHAVQRFYYKTNKLELFLEKEAIAVDELAKVPNTRVLHKYDDVFATLIDLMDSFFKKHGEYDVGIELIGEYYDIHIEKVLNPINEIVQPQELDPRNLPPKPWQPIYTVIPFV